MINLYWKLHNDPSYNLSCNSCKNFNIIKPNDSYLIIDTLYPIRVCGSCVNELWPTVRAAFDPALKFYE